MNLHFVKLHEMQRRLLPIRPSILIAPLESNK